MDQQAIRDQMSGSAIITAKKALEAGFLDGLRYDDEIRNSIALSAGLDSEKSLPTVSFSSYERQVRSKTRRGSEEIAVVYAVGTIMPGQSSEVPNPIFGGVTLGSDTFLKAIRRARRSNRTKALVVRIDSPGGIAPAADAMLQEIRAAATEMPVIISMGDVAASGGYWMAMGSGTVVAEPLTLTGSIGVFSLMFDASGFLEETLGISYDHVKSAPSADMFSGLRSYSAAERNLLQEMTDQTYASFLNLVSDARNIPVEEVDALAQGRVWTGTAALEAGLVDELGGMNRAIELAVDAAGIDPANMRVRVFAAPKGFLERFTQPLVKFASLVLPFSGADKTGPGISATMNHLSELVEGHGKVMARIPYLIEAK